VTGKKALPQSTLKNCREGREENLPTDNFFVRYGLFGSIGEKA
jgi:hypothetical protein